MNRNAKQRDEVMESKRGLIFNGLSAQSIKTLPLFYRYKDVKLNQGAGL
jgi:hypothetical protein